MTAGLYTASWTALWQASKVGPLPVQPVRTSRGVPKFWAGADRLPALDELMPDSWMLGIEDPERFGRSYRRKLYAIGVARIRNRLETITTDSGRPELPLALACFERARSDCHRGTFAAWYEERTGLAVPEWYPAKTTGHQSGRIGVAAPTQLSLTTEEEPR